MADQPTNISAISSFGWWELVIYKKEGEKFPFCPYHLGRCLGPCDDFGTEMCFNVLTESGKVIPVSTIWSLKKAELNIPIHQKKVKKFTKFILDRYGSSWESPIPDFDIDDLDFDIESLWPKEYKQDKLPKKYKWQSYWNDINPTVEQTPELDEF